MGLKKPFRWYLGGLWKDIILKFETGIVKIIMLNKKGNMDLENDN